jgi:hypothetical protein
MELHTISHVDLEGQHPPLSRTSSASSTSTLVDPPHSGDTAVGTEPSTATQTVRTRFSAAVKAVGRTVDKAPKKVGYILAGGVAAAITVAGAYGAVKLGSQTLKGRDVDHPENMSVSHSGMGNSYAYMIWLQPGTGV